MLAPIRPLERSRSAVVPRYQSGNQLAATRHKSNALGVVFAAPPNSPLALVFSILPTMRAAEVPSSVPFMADANAGPPFQTDPTQSRDVSITMQRRVRLAFLLQVQ